MAEERSTSRSSAQRPRPRGSVRASNPNIFSDYYALDPLELIDGQQTKLPGDGSHDGHDVAPLSQALDTRRRSLSFQQTPEGSFRRSRGSQRSEGQSSTSSRFDSHGSQTSRPPRSIASVSDLGNSLSTPHPSIRSISTFGFPRAQSPYQGATGPSHPYGMYPQDIGVARTPSVATTSTMRQPERSYSGPNGPTQPYGTYPQNTVPEDDQDAVAGMPLPIGAGFPGLQGQNFQRRLGPDGEDVDDLIGPDGYAEQLPPYSRYANGVPPKYSSGIGSFRRSTTAPILMEDSQETLNSSEIPVRMRGEASAVNPFGDSATELDSTTSAAAVFPKDEGGNFKERVRETSKKRVCYGVLPCWLLGSIIMVIVIAVFLGGIIGGVFAHRRGEEKGRQEASSTVTVPATVAAAAPTTTINTSNAPDVEPLTSTPSNLPPLPTGSYAITLDNPETLSNSCLTNTSQASAWDCATGANLSITVTMTNNIPQVQLSYPIPPNMPIRYGSQPPQFNGQAPMMLMESRANSNKGPTWIFLQYFNKTVILPQEDLPSPYPLPKPKRSLLERWFFNDEGLGEPTNLYKRDQYSQWTDEHFATPPDKPWYCFWNGTTLEGLIFVTQNADLDDDDSTAYPSAAATSATYPSASTSAPYPSSWQDPDQPSASQYKRHAPPSPSPYPKMVKIIERRIEHNAAHPYCQQMQILNTGQPAPLRDPVNGGLIIVNLTEMEPTLHNQVQQVAAGAGFPPSMPTFTPYGQGKRRANSKRSTPICQCQWMSGA